MKFKSRCLHKNSQKILKKKINFRGSSVYRKYRIVHTSSDFISTHTYCRWIGSASQSKSFMVQRIERVQGAFGCKNILKMESLINGDEHRMRITRPPANSAVLTEEEILLQILLNPMCNKAKLRTEPMVYHFWVVMWIRWLCLSSADKNFTEIISYTPEYENLHPSLDIEWATIIRL